MEQTLKEQIYGSEEEHRQKLARLDRDPKILEANKELIRQFLTDKAAEGVTTVRLNIILTAFVRVARISQKAFSAFEEKDVREVVGTLERKEISQWTKNISKSCLKILLKRLGKATGVYDWIRNKRPPNRLRSEDLLTEEEMGRMVAATDSPMWKALLGVLFECGLRPGELLTLRIKDVVRNGTKYKLYASGKLEKTSGTRTVYVYKNMPLLEQWLTIHAKKGNAESPLWITERKQVPLASDVFNIVYHKISRRARIEKKNWPYLARHTRLTQIYRDYGSIIGAKLAGHVVGSKEVRTYLHLSDADVERALDAVNGVKEVLKPEEPLKCPKCQLQNQYGKIFCAACQTALGAAGALIHEDENKTEAKALEAFTSDPKLMTLLRKLAENPELLSRIT